MKTTSVSLTPQQQRLTPHLGAVIAFWRGVRRMRQEDLAKASGVCLSTIKWLERGRKNGYRTDILEQVCEALDITMLELFSGAEKRARRMAGQR